jgi:hypothetical protein
MAAASLALCGMGRCDYMKAMGASPVEGRRGETIAALVLVTLLVIARSLVFLFEQAQFDSDQAVTGLMAKHIAELRAFPFYAYAADYVFSIESWIAAPFLAIFGTSVAALRAPLVLVNAAAGGLLVWMLARELRLRALVALLPAMFFVAAPPTLASELLTAVGGNSEPFVYVLLLWLVRERPVLYGAVFIVGFLNREFTAYALSALLAIETLQGRLWRPQSLKHKTVALIVMAIGWELARLLRMGADAAGPGTAPGIQEAAASNANVAVGFICQDLHWSRIVQNLTLLGTSQLAIIVGAPPSDLARVNIIGSVSQGLTGLWPVFVVVMLAALGRLGWLGVRAWRADGVRIPAEHDGLWFALYLALIGLQSGIVWAISRCDPLSAFTLRYGLLMVLVPVAVAAAYLSVERRAAGRALMIGFALVWSAASIRSHAQLAAQYLGPAPPPNEYRRLIEELSARGIKYVYADYWTAYMIDFLSDERIIATSTGYKRVAEYDEAVARHAEEAVLVSREPCPGGERVRRWFLCREERHR